jgi:hypothetical protein
MSDSFAKNIEVAQRIQEKFDFFLVALPFAVLALAVQTTLGAPTRIGVICELLGRGALLISGFAGLYRLEAFPRLYQVSAHKFSNEETLSTIRRAQSTGRGNFRASETGAPLDVEKRIADLATNIDGFSEVEKRMLASTARSYYVHKWCLVAGFIFLTVSRSTPLVQWLGETFRHYKP